MQSWCSLTRLWHERRSLEYVDEIFVAFPLNKRRREKASLFAFCSRLKKKCFPSYILGWNIEELRWQKLLNQSRVQCLNDSLSIKKHLDWIFNLATFLSNPRSTLSLQKKKMYYRVEKGLIYCEELARRTKKVPWSVMVLPFRVWWHWPIFLQTISIHFWKMSLTLSNSKPTGTGAGLNGKQT